MSSASTEPRKGMPSPQLSEGEFKRRFRSPHADPAFEPLGGEIERLAAVAWEAYVGARKSRLFACVVHGDVEGADGVRRSLGDWPRSIELSAAAELDRYIGYWKPFATSHQELDADGALQEEVRNTARALLHAVQSQRAGRLAVPASGLEPPRKK